VNYNLRYCANNPHVSVLGLKANEPFRRLFADTDLHNEIKCRYNELRRTGGPFDIARIEAKLDAFARHIERARARDNQRWNTVGKYTWPNNYIAPTWPDEVRYLKYWIRRRLAWLDRNMTGTCASVAAAAPPAAVMHAPPARETVARMPVCCSNAPAYVPIEGPVDPALAMFACP
jgi:hypothetical protein